LLNCYLSQISGNSNSKLEQRALRWKKILTFINISAFLMAVYYFWKHNNDCEALMYTKFAFCEYVVVLSNMGFHMMAYLDFYHKELTITSPEKLS